MTRRIYKYEINILSSRRLSGYSIIEALDDSIENKEIVQDIIGDIELLHIDNYDDLINYIRGKYTITDTRIPANGKLYTDNQSSNTAQIISHSLLLFGIKHITVENIDNLGSMENISSDLIKSNATVVALEDVQRLIYFATIAKAVDTIIYVTDKMYKKITVVSDLDNILKISDLNKGE